MNKQTLRRVYLEKRLTLAENEYHARNKAVLNHVSNFIHKHPELIHIHLFKTIVEKKEVDTQPIFDLLFKSKKHQIYLPKVINKTELSHHLLSENDVLKRSKWGIPEPTNHISISEDILDLVFIPLLSFDLAGNRIGYGAGFYDRFLSKCKKSCLKVGLAITPPLDNIDFTEEFDIKLDQCITHHGIYRF